MDVIEIINSDQQALQIYVPVFFGVLISTIHKLWVEVSKTFWKVLQYQPA